MRSFTQTIESLLKVSFKRNPYSYIMTKIYIDEKTATDEKCVLLGNTELKKKQDFKFTFILVKSITPLLHLPPSLLNSF